MSRSEDKKARLLTMDELQARPCEVDGRPALFHRWLEEDRVLIKFNERLPSHAKLGEVRRALLAEGIVPAQYDSEVIHEFFALVEYQDGTIGKVDPVLLRFLDRE